MASDRHQHKKQFQPSISSYFDRQCDTSSSPPLPAETQASLISVGMRVRKSVPEGYKTHKTVINSVDPVERRLPSSQPTLERWSSRELMPFSGIHKIGGYAQQSHCSSTAPEHLSTTSSNSLPSFTTSQDSIASAESVIHESAPRKRSYEEEMEESMDLYFDEMDQEEELRPRKIAQPKAYSRRQRMLHILDGAGDFPDAHFLQPADDVDTPDGYL